VKSTQFKLSRLLVGATFLLTLGASGQALAESHLDKIKRTGVFLAGIRPDAPPFGSLDNSGNPVGFGPELSKKLAEKLGVQVKYINVTSAARIPMLQNGTIDADIGVTTPTRQRNEEIDFTTPYVWNSMVLLVKKGSSLKIEDYGPPKKISATQGSSSAEYVKQALPNAQIVTFQDNNDVAMAVLQGKVDAAAFLLDNAREVAAKHPDYVIGEKFAVDPIAIGVHQDDSKWLNWLNFSLQEMWVSGEYQKLYAKYFGGPPDWQIWSAYRLQPGIGK
jgi:polar amino acid transport system substrate-binding protein